MVGEFGRTVGPLTAAAGRDHWPQQFAFFAGGGVKGGTRHRRRPTPPAPTPPITAGRRIATSIPRISRRRSTPRWASTGPPSATTIRSAAASSTCRRPIRCSISQSTNSGEVSARSPLRCGLIQQACALLLAQLLVERVNRALQFVVALNFFIQAGLHLRHLLG